MVAKFWESEPIGLCQLTARRENWSIFDKLSLKLSGLLFCSKARSQPHFLEDKELGGSWTAAYVRMHNVK